MARTKAQPQYPVCGFTFDAVTCRKRGEHLCAPRVTKVSGFFADVLVHTKGRWSRQRFELSAWQAREIVGPLFGTVVYSDESHSYVRRYRIAWLELARKNGKALDVSTPILAAHGWTTMGELQAGDDVHAIDGSLTRVQWVSDRHVRPSYRVTFADGAQLIAADDHKWTVNDRRMSMTRVVTTQEIAETLYMGVRYRYSVDVPGAISTSRVPVPYTPVSTNTVVAVESFGPREVVCIAVDHPSHVFLAGESLTPTHNSELLAGVALYLLLADDEEGAEIYGCARDREQARKVFDVAERMVKLSPFLSRRLKIYAQAKRIVDERTGSYYEIVAADAAGNLGHNPHGVVLDEVITQRDGSLWSAMRTAMGARTQPLMVAATTAGDDLQSFGYNEHVEMQKIADDPERARHVFVYMRNTDKDADPWDEKNWRDANPALGSFLSIQALRDEATEARNDPGKENAFRQFRLNQWVSQSSRWMPMHLWDATSGDLWLKPDWAREQLIGRIAYGGLDLAAKFDLTAWCLILPPDDDETPVDALWRFWLPETGLERLDKLNDGKFTRWARDGWITVTEGGVIDYDRVVADIAEDAGHFSIQGIDSDEWSMWPIIGRIADACGLDADAGEVTAYRNTYDRMSGGMDEVFGLVKSQRFAHHGNPVARFCFDACEVRHAPYDPNLVRPSKPERATNRSRIDAVPTAVMAANAWRMRESVPLRISAYETDKLMVV